jgi:chromosome segregation ATPase
MSHILLQLQKLEEAETNAKTTIQRIQQQIDESAKQMTTENAEYQKQKQELEEKYQKENSELEVLSFLCQNLTFK